MKLNNITLHSKHSLVIFCLLLLLLLQFPMLVYAEADHDWIVRLRQSPGTKAAVQGGWTRDGNPIDHPGGFYTLYCEGEEKTKRISKAELAVEPNDADYDIRIWWPDGTFERHDFERIHAPGSKTYSHSPISVVFEVFPAPVTGYNTFWIIFTAISLMLAGGYLIFRKKRKAAFIRIQDKQQRRSVY